MFYSRTCCAGLCLVSSDTLVPAAPEDTTPITGFPEGSWINYTSWSPDGKHITFTTRSPGAAHTQRQAEQDSLREWFAQRGTSLGGRGCTKGVMWIQAAWSAWLILCKPWMATRVTAVMTVVAWLCADMPFG